MSHGARHGSGAATLESVVFSDCQPGSVVVRAPASKPIVPGREAWSRFATPWLRKHGFNVEPEGRDSFEISIGGACHTSKGLVEGPCDGGWWSSIGLDVRACTVESLDLHGAEELHLRGIGFSGDIVRRIPGGRGERSEPRPWVPVCDLTRTPPLSVQFLDTGSSWERLVEARAPDGSQGCVVARRGELTVTGLPLFAIAARYQWMPPVDEGYYTIERRCWSDTADLWLAGLVEESALAAGIRLSRRNPWPQGTRSALTVRFDHDRPISTKSLEELLSLLDAHGLKASWGFLARLSDPATMDAVSHRGHEIVLHSEAGSRAQLHDELRHFRARGHDVRGVTAHGGIGSAGHLGQRLHEWAAAEGLEHADTLSRDSHLPHPALAVTDTGITELPLYLPPWHQSLDTGTRPEAHALTSMLSDIPLALDRGGLVTIMNHPDIHREQLQSLLESLDLSGVWRASHRDAVRCVRASTVHARSGGGQLS